MRVQFTILPYVVVGLVSGFPAWAVSDDANPWLAIENAVCVSHRGVNYSDEVGVQVVIAEAQWRGAADELPSHCFLSGTIEGELFEIRLPTQGNGLTYSRAVGSNDIETALDALSQGFTVLFGAASTRANDLLKAAAEHHYTAFDFRP